MSLEAPTSSYSFISTVPSATKPTTWGNCTNPDAVFWPRQPQAVKQDPFRDFCQALAADDTSWWGSFQTCYPIFGTTSPKAEADQTSSQSLEDKDKNAPSQLDQPEKELKEQKDQLDLVRALNGLLEVTPQTTEEDQLKTQSQPGFRIKHTRPKTQTTVKLKKKKITLEEAMAKDDIKRVKEIIAQRDPNTAAPLDYAILREEYKLANFLKKHGEKTSRPVVFLVGDEIGCSLLEGRLAKTLMKDEVLTVTIFVPVRFDRIGRDLASFLKKLPPGTNRPQAILKSGLPEVEAIKEAAAEIFDHGDGIWLHGDMPNIWPDLYETGGYSLPAVVGMIYQDILQFAMLDLHHKATYKPVLAVDRGMQLTNIFYGGTLKDQPDRDLKHLVTQEDSGILGSVLPFPALGWVEQEQTIDEVGLGLEVVATSEDGLVEAMQAETDAKPLMATQFHPELLRSETFSESYRNAQLALMNTYDQVLNQFVAAVKASWEETCLAHDLKKMKLK
ncbi:MAG: gamma-glutamyl-gamma-aminobutyrate hydrolase family protein [Candidatus Berkiellales bacterium]